MSVAVGAPLSVALFVIASRLSRPETFVTLPVVAFVLLAIAVAVRSAWVGASTPLLFATGILPAAFISYLLPVLPMPVVGAILLAGGWAALRLRGYVAGIACAVAVFMVLLVLIQDPAVSCGSTSTSTSSGPWWTPDSNSGQSSSASGGPGGEVRGTTTVGGVEYSYRCSDGELTRFEKTSP
jgi:hypothetical protein